MNSLLEYSASFLQNIPIPIQKKQKILKKRNFYLQNYNKTNQIRFLEFEHKFDNFLRKYKMINLFLNVLYQNVLKKDDEILFTMYLKWLIEVDERIRTENNSLENDILNINNFNLFNPLNHILNYVTLHTKKFKSIYKYSFLIKSLYKLNYRPRILILDAIHYFKDEKMNFLKIFEEEEKKIGDEKILEIIKEEFKIL